MRKGLLILAFASLINAQDILTQYRLGDIKDVQKSLDSELSVKEYWQNIVANVDTKFGYIESAINILTCNKKSALLELSVMDKNNNFHIRFALKKNHEQSPYDF